MTFIPEFLDSQHKIANADDAEAYLERVKAMARLMDQQSTWVAEQAGSQHRQPQRQRQMFNQQQRGVTTEHENGAVRQITHAQHAKNQREAQGKQLINAAQGRER